IRSGPSVLRQGASNGHGSSRAKSWQAKCLPSTRRTGFPLPPCTGGAMQVVLQDLRFAVRQIIRNPGFSVTAVLSLTLGIGATVAVYSILYDAVLHPWPYAGIERICDVWISDSAGHAGPSGLTGPQIRLLRQTHAVEDVAVSNYTSQTVTGG